ncbi:FecR family protein [Variovorax ginsengisoli]|uniref:Transmembrane sensor n=1 Tax=Variovorax ginsengisoli TaxID=363844 RepID=A0ABT9SAQ1_9BURK|nr:FecR domain-containing protein [Variovorax ginsengisoli]MDP9901418.1 transmembrane sensor [Variovorax ginsengisoli]
MNDPHSPPPDAARQHEEMREWSARRSRSEWKLSDEKAFQAWLAGDPKRLAALTQWEEGEPCSPEPIPPEAIAMLRRQLARDRAEETDRRSSIQSLRPRALRPGVALTALIMVAAAAALLGWQNWQARPVYTAAFDAPDGQPNDVRLPDGSRLRLDAATHLEVHYYRQRRELSLRDGRVSLTVRNDIDRPFDVLAGPLRVQTPGARFAVQHTPEVAGRDGVQVSVEQGRVGLMQRNDDPSAEPAAVLQGGQQIASDRQGHMGPVMPLPSAS